MNRFIALFVALLIPAFAASVVKVGVGSGKTGVGAGSGKTKVEATVSGGAAWIDTVASGDTTANVSVPFVGEQWSNITLTTGNATKLRMYIRGFSSTSALKLGLHNSSGTLLASGAMTVSGTGSAEVTISSTAVTAGTYKVSWVSDTGPGAISYGKTTSGTTYFNVSGSYYTLFATIPSPDGSDTATASVGVYIE